MTTFRSILVANRGEIAVRIMRSAKTLGYKTIAVYSEADADAPHVQLADDAALIGPAPVAESYLDMTRILKAARETGADAIHPGYGFLSENAEFAKACEDAGLVFIGPTGESIDLMGNKAAAKRRMIDAGVPCVPGYEGEDQSDSALLTAAHDIGYPLMVKAAAGGGGRGMRLVFEESDLQIAIETARSEAENAFGSGELILEKAIVRPRHVEVQVFADTHGNAIHLGERDCSVQRRHQKVVEEAPCPIMTAELRARMGAAAVDAARSINYRGAGTVEFLLDEQGEFYFLEMNTRLQVEHPVTEMITGLDLVALQIRVAEGKTLGVAQEEVSLSGHAIEVRLYAEDPAQDFLPVTGTVDLWVPAEGEGVRIDSGIATGQEISPFYDPMLAKIIAWGETREMAGNRLVDALKRTTLFGTTTNKRFLMDVLERETFKKGQATTAFIEEEFETAQLDNGTLGLQEAGVAAVLQYIEERDAATAASLGINAELQNWGSPGHLVTRYVYSVTDQEMDLTVLPQGPTAYLVNMGEEQVAVELLTSNGCEAMVAIDGRRSVVTFLCPAPGTIHLAIEGRTLTLRNEVAFAGLLEEVGGGGRIVAPMHGALLEIFVKEGDLVEKGTRLAVLEAMKMQHQILAEVKGTVSGVHAKAGTQVAADDLLIEIEIEIEKN
ncbi:MAG: acetyl-CoA carboxylase biotin carboxylase subunit [Deltaproteobacteria bacterium]|nr:acetyl-CoA carboxylase biotin carboxylase subunit [Deltaproteobacteria bacterium]MBT6498377.1 acetyl-CoA carboxylase biotin carboxylase subunit [Deltaproteobacteria bacterium]MBT7151470.1 acetyl-CoA carboxylase biotin carboxylase subunit [Deltaproteobacteria bacterium]MBT7716323.1 acetyl-CoA carboxylase biotin carboxylase subunit [Deltaproteobacteria bacterium]